MRIGVGNVLRRQLRSYRLILPKAVITRDLSLWWTSRNTISPEPVRLN